MIPDIRRGVLCVEKAAECLEEFEKEAMLTAKEEKNKEVRDFHIVNFYQFFMAGIKSHNQLCNVKV